MLGRHVVQIIPSLTLYWLPLTYLRIASSFYQISCYLTFSFRGGYDALFAAWMINDLAERMYTMSLE